MATHSGEFFFQFLLTIPPLWRHAHIEWVSLLHMDTRSLHCIGAWVSLHPRLSCSQLPGLCKWHHKRFYTADDLNTTLCLQNSSTHCPAEARMFKNVNLTTFSSIFSWSAYLRPLSRLTPQGEPFIQPSKCFFNSCPSVHKIKPMLRQCSCNNPEGREQPRKAGSAWRKPPRTKHLPAKLVFFFFF